MAPRNLVSMSSSLESPIAAILAQAKRLRLTPEQQVELRRFGLDFEVEAARLLSERCLLQIETERKHICDGTLLGFTPEEVASIDEQTAKLRLAWAAALNNARSILSPEQQKKLQPQVRLPPSFEWEFVEKGEDLDARVTRVISAQLKDTKVLEMETAQAITDRLLTWSKWFALAIGAPLTLGAIVLGGLGYRTYSDFTSTVSSVEERARDQINNAAAAKTREFEGRAHKLELGFNQLENKLIELQTLPEKVQNLTNRLQRLEQIEIRAPSDVSSDKTSRLQKQIEEFRA